MVFLLVNTVISVMMTHRNILTEKIDTMTQLMLEKGWNQMSKKRKCPRCKRMYRGYPALSRRDNETEICSDCGTAEALSDYILNKGV